MQSPTGTWFSDDIALMTERIWSVHCHWFLMLSWLPFIITSFFFHFFTYSKCAKHCDINGILAKYAAHRKIAFHSGCALMRTDSRFSIRDSLGDETIKKKCYLGNNVISISLCLRTSNMISRSGRIGVRYSNKQYSRINGRVAFFFYTPVEFPSFFSVRVSVFWTYKQYRNYVKYNLAA